MDRCSARVWASYESVQEVLTNLLDNSADSARTRSSHNGSGLGLTLVKKLVEHMGGTVGVDSEPGKGAALFFTVPLAP